MADYDLPTDLTEDAIPLQDFCNSGKSEHHGSEGWDQRSPVQPVIPADRQQDVRNSPVSGAVEVQQRRLGAEMSRTNAASTVAGTSTTGTSSEALQEKEEREMQRDVLKGIGKALSACDLNFVDINDEVISQYKFKFPDELKVDYYDGMILYHEGNKCEVQKFLKMVHTEVLLFEKVKPKLALYDEIFPDCGNPVGILDKTLDLCTYVFLYITSEFCKDQWTEFSSQTALMNAINERDKKWSVVPIFTQPKRDVKYRTPPSINSLKGIQSYNKDIFIVDSLRRLLEDRFEIRRKKGDEQKLRRIEWISKEKRKEAREARERHQRLLKASQEESLKGEEINQTSLEASRPQGERPAGQSGDQHDLYRAPSDHGCPSQQQHSAYPSVSQGYPIPAMGPYGYWMHPVNFQPYSSDYVQNMPPIINHYTFKNPDQVVIGNEVTLNSSQDQPGCGMQPPDTPQNSVNKYENQPQLPPQVSTEQNARPDATQNAPLDATQNAPLDATQNAPLDATQKAPCETTQKLSSDATQNPPCDLTQTVTIDNRSRQSVPPETEPKEPGQSNSSSQYGLPDSQSLGIDLRNPSSETVSARALLAMPALGGPAAELQQWQQRFQQSQETELKKPLADPED